MVRTALGPPPLPPFFFFRDSSRLYIMTLATCICCQEHIVHFSILGPLDHLNIIINIIVKYTYMPPALIFMFPIAGTSLAWSILCSTMWNVSIWLECPQALGLPGYIPNPWALGNVRGVYISMWMCDNALSEYRCSFRQLVHVPRRRIDYWLTKRC